MSKTWRMAVAGALATVLAVTLGLAPAGAEPSDPTAEEREEWSEEERLAHGQELWSEPEVEKAVNSQESPAQILEVDAPQITGDPAATALPPAVTETISLDEGAEGAQASGSDVPVTLTLVDDVPAAGEAADAQDADTDDGSDADADADDTASSGVAFDVVVGDAAAAEAAGVDGLVLEVQPTSDSATDVTVDIAVDYSAFADVYGGDWAQRLELVSLPDCDLAAPDGDCGEQVALDSVNDTEGSMLRARVAPESMGTFAVTASTEGSAGSWSATSLSPSATWNVSEQTGSFSWSYPLRVPPAPGGPAPDLSLGYSSSSVDGRVASTNNQTSWVGEGWGLSEGYVERRYASCAEDAVGGNNASRLTGDLCWRSDNATLVFNGGAVELVKDVATGTWKPKSDDGSRVERLTGGWGGGQNGEYWKVTTADGVQYFFGRGKRSATDSLALNSAWNVPVYGNHPGDPCYNVAFASSSCEQTWRWNLDYVLDPSGNSMTYVYEKETNNYGRNLNTAVSSYTRGGYLARIEYGQRAGSEGANAPARVEFTTAERCLPNASTTCAPTGLNASTASHWPDTPADLICTSSTSCTGQTSPAFFTRKRLVTITTKVWNGSAYRNVDSWTLAHQFPDPGDATSRLLWLASIQHQGLAGSTITLPKVEFTGIQLPNRVDESGNLGPRMNRYRVSAIKSESGGTIAVQYADKDCTPANLPASAETNTRRCFPIFWDPQGPIEPIQEYFHKYVVTQLLENPATNDSPGVITSYSYPGGAAWHYDDNELTKPQYRTWGEFRGYDTVDVTVGASSTEQLKTRYRFFRGMDQDRLAPAGGTRSVSIDGITDHEEFNGQTREEITYNGAATISATRQVPWRSAPTATGADGATARYTGIETAEELTYGSTLPGGVRTTRSVTTFDGYGMPTQVDDQGDVATAADDRCTRTEYARNTTTNMLDRVRRVETVAKNCATAPARPADVISDQRTSYDGGTYGAAPTRGLATNVSKIASYSGSTPTYVTVNSATYDTHGRLLTASDALGRTTTTAYTPAVGGLVTKMMDSSPDPDGAGPLTPHVTQTDLDPAWGSPIKITDPAAKVTTGTYDALGRLTQVWQPGRTQGTDTPHTKYGYTVGVDGTNAVTTETLIHDGTYRRTVEIYDGLLRERQSQSPTADRNTAGRIVTGTTYDSRGLPTTRNSPWYTTGDVSTVAVTPTTAVPGRKVLEHDGAGRVSAEITQVGEQETLIYNDKWRTTTTYNGNRVSVTPPTGGVPTTTVTDARGNTTQLLSYTGSTPTGTANTVTYTYDAADRMTGMRDYAGNNWTYTYDLRGRQTSNTDPDTGTSTATYDNADQKLTSTDARGVTLATVYDNLGRRTQLREGSATGTLHASWTWDTLAKGQLTSSSRVKGTSTYTTATTAFDDGYRPLSTSVTIPAIEGALAGTYTTTYTYTLDGQLKTTTLPEAGDMGSETVTTNYDNRSMPSMVGGGPGWGLYMVSGTYSVYGETLKMDLGSIYSQNLNFSYEHGTRRPERTWLQREGQSSYEIDIAYGYDQAGNITRIGNTPPDKPADVQCFTYDNQARLNQAWTPTSGNCAATRSVTTLGGPAPYWNSYTHSAIGNRTATTTRTPTATRTSSSTYPATGAARPHAVTGITTSGTGGTTTNSYTYDASGNTLTRSIAGQPAQTLTWDAEGRLATLSQGSSGAHGYTYTADGDRLIRNQAGAKTLYLPGGQEVTQTGGTTTAVRYYTVNGKTVAMRTAYGATSTSTLISDHHATAELAVNNWTNAPTRRYHDPYGTPRGNAPSPAWSAGDHGFLNKPTDTTGLTQIGARYYDTTAGRFISPDPLLDRGQPQQWAAYTYANGSPVTLSDPTGLAPSFATHDGGRPGFKTTNPSRSSAANSRKDTFGSGSSTSTNRSSRPATTLPSVTINVPVKVSTGRSCQYNDWSCRAYTIEQRPTTYSCGTSMAVGFSSQQMAINEACGRAVANNHLAKKPKWVQNLNGMMTEQYAAVQPAIPLLGVAAGGGIVYRRVDANTGSTYIGKTRSDSRFAARQTEHDRAHRGADFEYEIVGRAEPGVQLSRLEEYFIREGGGPTNLSNPNGGLANKRHEMNPNRYLEAGGDPL